MKGVNMNNQITPIFNNMDSNYESILKLNKGKKIKVYITIPYSEFKDKEFSGILEQNGQNYIILSDPNDGNWYLILNEYISFICFLEGVNCY